MENHPFTSMSYRLKMGDLPFRKLANDQIMSPLCPIKAHENPMKNPIIQITMKIPIKITIKKMVIPLKSPSKWTNKKSPFLEPKTPPIPPAPASSAPPAPSLAASAMPCRRPPSLPRSRGAQGARRQRRSLGI